MNNLFNVLLKIWTNYLTQCHLITFFVFFPYFFIFMSLNHLIIVFSLFTMRINLKTNTVPFYLIANTDL